MFDFEEIEDDVKRKGADSWQEVDKTIAKLVEEADRRAGTIASQVAAAVPDRGGRTRTIQAKNVVPNVSSTSSYKPVDVFEQAIGACKALIHKPTFHPGDAPRPVVVICPGNPSKSLGASHMGAPLIVELFNAIGAAGFPVLRFDYRGVGCSAIEEGGWDVPDPKDACEDTLQVARWSLEHLSDNLVMAGYSFGTSMSLGVLMEHLPQAFIAVSCGTEQWKMWEGDAQESERRKADLAKHSKLQVPAVYICGENDWITNQDELKKLIAAREDSGQGVTVHVIPGVKHELLGKEDEAARLAVEWLKACVFLQKGH